MDDARTAFTVAFPEARKYRALRIISAVCFILFWILTGATLYGAAAAEIPKWPVFIVAGIALAAYLGFSTYEKRKLRELAPVISRRFAEEFTARTEYDCPQGVDILSVQRSIAVRRRDGSVLLWGVSRSKDAFNVFPMT
ncbi:hypothetical protein AB0O52_11045 [Arthrobacter sp. NPDC080073]|uniref:hypothetical protein n=1 Tax=Arthrobacter sp. NPDC080073 TaxID=3155919 RepID=UPI003423861C